MITFKGLPLFGKDSSPHNTSKILGFIGTCVIWIILFICLMFIKPSEKKPKYKEVQIVLETKTVDKTESIKETPKIVENYNKTEVKKSDSAKNTEVVKKESKKETESLVTEKVSKVQEDKSFVKEDSFVKDSFEDQWDDFEYALDPMEAFAQQTSKKESVWDESLFEEATTVDASNNISNKVIGENSFSGTAGISSKTSSAGATSSVVQNQGVHQQSQVSKETSETLGEIMNAKFVNSSTDNLSSEATVKVSRSESGKVYIEMKNGKSRALLKPASPEIKLSKEAAALIDGTRNVVIKFMVLKNGTVPASQIEITPSAILPELVQKEIKNQISNWIFESDNYDAFGDFEYKIIKK